MLNVDFLTVTANWVKESHRNSKIHFQITVTQTEFKEKRFSQKLNLLDHMLDFWFLQCDLLSEGW